MSLWGNSLRLQGQKYVEPCVEASKLSLGWKKQVSKDKIWDLLGRELRELSLWGTAWDSRDKKYVEPGVETSILSLGMEEASGQGQNMGLPVPGGERIVLGGNSLRLQGLKICGTGC